MDQLIYMKIRLTGTTWSVENLPHFFKARAISRDVK
jgi:hypothetical protein